MNEQSSGFFVSTPGRRGEEIDTPAPLFRASFDLSPPHSGHSSIPPQLVKCKCLVVADAEPRVHQSTSLGPLPFSLVPVCRVVAAISMTLLLAGELLPKRR